VRIMVTELWYQLGQILPSDKSIPVDSNGRIPAE
jgi:hypothetical protein